MSSSNVATLAIVSGPAQIDRYNRARSINFEIELNQQPLGAVEQAGLAPRSPKNLPPGVSPTTVGDAEAMARLFGSLGLALLSGVLCIHIVLVLLFNDFVQPATILLVEYANPTPSRAMGVPQEPQAPAGAAQPAQCEASNPPCSASTPSSARSCPRPRGVIAGALVQGFGVCVALLACVSTLAIEMLVNAAWIGAMRADRGSPFRSGRGGRKPMGGKVRPGAEGRSRESRTHPGRGPRSPGRRPHERPAASGSSAPLRGPRSCSRHCKTRCCCCCCPWRAGSSAGSRSC